MFFPVLSILLSFEIGIPNVLSNLDHSYDSTDMSTLGTSSILQNSALSRQFVQEFHLADRLTDRG